MGAAELVSSLLSLSSLTGPLSSNSSSNAIAPSEVKSFLTDIVQRFEPDGELDDVLGPVIRLLLSHPSLSNPQGIAGADSSWRSILAGLDILVTIKPIAALIPRMPEFNPPNANASNFEYLSLLGRLLRLNVYERDWVRSLCLIT